MYICALTRRSFFQCLADGIQLQRRLPRSTLSGFVEAEKASMSADLKEDALLEDGVFRATSGCTVLTHRISKGGITVGWAN